MIERTVLANNISSIGEVTRVRAVGVYPVEVWDVEVGGGLLGDFIDSEEFSRQLLTALRAIRVGDAKTATVHDHASLLPCEGFEAVFICGGNVRREELESVLMQPDFALHISGADEFVTRAGGQEVLARRGCAGIIVDIGQSAIKISTGSLRFRYERDFSILPAIGLSDVVDKDRYRSVLRRFVAESIHDACSRIGSFKFDSVLFALPCELDEQGIPGSSSYPGMEGEGQFLPKTIRLAGLKVENLFVINDAELAAVSVTLDPQVKQYEKVMVVTLGYGVGGALILTGELR